MMRFTHFHYFTSGLPLANSVVQRFGKVEMHVSPYAAVPLRIGWHVVPAWATT